MIVPIAIFVVLVAVVIGAMAYRARPPRGIESGISSFRKELDALAPRRPPVRGPGDAGGQDAVGPDGGDDPEDSVDEGGADPADPAEG